MSDTNGEPMNNLTTRNLMGRAPSTAIVIAATVAFIVVVGAFTVLIVSGKDTQTLADLIGRVVAMLGALLGAGGMAYSASAARSAAAAKDQTNGSLDLRMEAAVSAGIAKALAHEPAAPAPVPAPVIVKLQPGDTIPGSYPNATVPTPSTP